VYGGAQQVASDPCQHISGEHAEWAHQGFAQQAKIPQAPHVGGEMNDPDMDEGRGQQTPPLA